MPISAHWLCGIGYAAYTSLSFTITITITRVGTKHLRHDRPCKERKGSANQRPAGYLPQEALPGQKEFLVPFLNCASTALYTCQSPGRLRASHHQPGYRDSREGSQAPHGPSGFSLQPHSL